MYKVYYMNQFQNQYRTRDEALGFISRMVIRGATRENFEILDGSDFQ